MKDNDPQTVGELLSKEGKRRASAARRPPVAGQRDFRPLIRLFAILLVIVAFAAGVFFFLGDAFIKTSRQGGDVVTGPREGRPVRSEVKTPASPEENREPVNANTAAAPPTVAGRTPELASEGAARPEKTAKNARQNAAPQVPPEATPQRAQSAEVAPETAPPVAGNEGGGSVTVQVGSHASAADAARQVERLMDAGIEARVVRAMVPNYGIRYRVQTGRFQDRAEAERYARRLRAMGFVQESFVTAGR